MRTHHCTDYFNYFQKYSYREYLTHTHTHTHTILLADKLQLLPWQHGKYES